MNKDTPIKVSYGVAIQLIVVFFAGCGFYFTVLNDIKTHSKTLNAHERKLSELNQKFDAIQQSLIKIEAATTLTNYRIEQMEKPKR